MSRNGGSNVFENTGCLEKCKVPAIAKVLEYLAWVFDADLLNLWIFSCVLLYDIIQFSTVARALIGGQDDEL